MVQTTFISSLNELLTVDDEFSITRNRYVALKRPVISYSLGLIEPYKVWGYDNNLEYVQSSYSKPFTDEQLQEWYQQQLLLMKLNKLTK